MFWLTGLLGLALGMAPWGLQYSNNNAAMWTSVALGALIVLASAYKGLARGNEMWEYAIIGLTGLGALVAPFVLQFTGLTWALATCIAVGAVAVIASGLEVFVAGGRISTLRTCAAGA